MRNFAIGVLNVAIVIIIGLNVLIGLVVGWGVGDQVMGTFGALIGLLIGGGVGFLLGCLFAALIFIQMDIRDNTLRMVELLEQRTP